MILMDSTPASALLFPGQGSQFVGMGKALAESEPIARDTFKEADELVGYPLSKLCWEGPSDQLNETLNTQPAILTHSIAVHRTILSKNPSFSPDFTAGHSVGEFSALVASGAISFQAGLSLVRERGRLMREAGLNNPGGMSAVLGLEIEQVEQILEQLSDSIGNSVWVANDNCPGQVVISGEESGLNKVEEHLSDAGARKVVRLAVSIASHSPLMTQAQDEFKAILEDALITDPVIPIIGNVRATLLSSVEEIREDLREQLTSRVRWTESINTLTNMGVKTYYELGPGKVLTGLMRRIDRSNTSYPIDAPTSISSILAEMPSTS
jgi:[acyl-carrier-protein] S-malonyltransferase